MIPRESTWRTSGGHQVLERLPGGGAGGGGEPAAAAGEDAAEGREVRLLEPRRRGLRLGHQVVRQRVHASAHGTKLPQVLGRLLPHLPSLQTQQSP